MYPEVLIKIFSKVNNRRMYAVKRIPIWSVCSKRF